MPLTPLSTVEMPLLTIVQEFCRRKGLPQPQTVTGAQDDLTLQIWGLMNEGIQDIASRYNHQQLQTKLSFTHAAGADNLAYDFGQFTPDWKFLIPQTLWSSTNRLPVRGPLSMTEWQTLSTMLVAQSLYSFIIFGNAIHIFSAPAVPASVTFTCYYQSKYGVFDPASSIGGTNPGLNAYCQSYYSDNSIPRLPSALVLADLKWRYAKEKGLAYAEDQRTSEQMLMNAVGGEDQGVLVMDGGGSFGGFPPGVIVPAGNWNV